ncbi:MAG: SPOR domain-containing protein [Bacteroidales bacterium]|nr:SPOR domain-containing protein [Bacteroidales bacterium]MBD5283055.1 SPOR domain-containing protein [Bacteroides sp.]
MRLLSKLPVALLLGVALCPLRSFAQSESPRKVVENIESESEGFILIDAPEDLLDTLLANPDKKSHNGSGNKGYQASGFRIQVFSDGRNQHSLESRAKARGAAIVSKFPKYRGQIYSFSSSPNWYTRVGNFRSQAEANQALAELKRAFPQFASEMRVVKSKIINN